jgi:hypothetical protein
VDQESLEQRANMSTFLSLKFVHDDNKFMILPCSILHLGVIALSSETSYY